MRVRPTLTVLILAALLAVVAPSAAVAGDGGRPLGADLTGAAEVPGPGDPDGAGSQVGWDRWRAGLRACG